MSDPLVIVGAGGFGREVVETVRAINRAEGAPWEVRGVVDDAPSPANLALLESASVPYLGTTADAVERVGGTWFVVGVGSPSARRTIAERLERRGWRPATLVHPDATVGSSVSLGEGTIVCSGARLTTDVVVGRHVHVDTNVTVGHDVRLGDFVRLNPASSISGDCVVEAGALVGVGAVVLNQRRVGAGAIVGGAACVARDVPARAVVKGVPAR